MKLGNTYLAGNTCKVRECLSSLKYLQLRGAYGEWKYLLKQGVPIQAKKDPGMFGKDLLSVELTVVCSSSMICTTSPRLTSTQASMAARERTLCVAGENRGWWSAVGSGASAQPAGTCRKPSVSVTPAGGATSVTKVTTLHLCLYLCICISVSWSVCTSVSVPQCLYLCVCASVSLPL